MSHSAIRSIAVRVMLLLAAGGLAACTAKYATENSSPVLMFIADVNQGRSLAADVLENGAVVANSIDISVAVRFKNPGVLTIPSVPNGVRVERYEVAYRRSDGRGVQGQDVPFTISGNVSRFFNVSLTDADGMTIEVVRAQAKLEPPLRNLRGATSTSGFGGALVVTMFADITVFGRTISGIPVTSTGTLQIDFADYGS